MAKEEVQIIVTKNGRYNLYNYQKEEEFEKIIIEHSKEIFGENTHYFDIKKKIKFNKMTNPKLKQTAQDIFDLAGVKINGNNLD